LPTDVLKAALDWASDGILILDGDLVVRHVNPAAASVFGADGAELVGSHIGRVGSEELEQQLAKLAQFPAAERAELPEMTIRRRDGSRIRAASWLCPLVTGDERRHVLFVRDITREVEQRDRLALLHELADRTNRGVIVADRELRTVYTNAAF